MARPYPRQECLDLVTITTWRNEATAKKCFLHVHWMQLGLRSQALLLSLERAHSTLENLTPSLFWYDSTGTETGQYEIPTDNFKLTAYGLASTGMNSYKILSSSPKTLIRVFSSDETQRHLFLETHTMDRSILEVLKDYGAPFGIAMDKSRSHLVFTAPAGTSKHQSLLLCQLQGPFEERIFMKGTNVSELKQKTLEPTLPSRRDLNLKVLVLEKAPSHPLSELLHMMASSITLKTKTYLSKEDLQELMERALHHRQSKVHEKVLLTHFFRNKPRQYFNNIFLTRGGLMEIYKKDANGDQDSAINNGNLFGLFFSAALHLDTHQPPTHSYFGDIRLLVAAPILFCDSSRLYFADFYCNNKAHYITLVLTKQGSEADQFCQKRLIELDPGNNPFLTREPAVLGQIRATTSMSAYRGYNQYQSTMYDYPLSDLGTYSRRHPAFNSPMTSAVYDDFRGHQSASPRSFSRTAYSSMHHPAVSAAMNARVYTTLCHSLHIEVLYTENVPMTKLEAQYGKENVSWGPCPTLGRGSSLPNGIPKNPRCSLCNLPRAEDPNNLLRLFQNWHI